MSLGFPNESRFYDGAVHAVRFSGYDGAMEAPFFVGERALKQIQPDMPSDEAGLLKAFDRNRDRIYDDRGQGVRARTQRLVRPAARGLLDPLRGRRVGHRRRVERGQAIAADLLDQRDHGRFEPA